VAHLLDLLDSSGTRPPARRVLCAAKSRVCRHNVVGSLANQAPLNPGVPGGRDLARESRPGSRDEGRLRKCSRQQTSSIGSPSATAVEFSPG
jgi:hypothetical protein